MIKGSRFATQEEIKSLEFRDVISDMCRLHRAYSLPDHFEVNQARYPWSVDMQFRPEVYASRLWEYPFCILSANLQPGMLCADIGCGMSAFTIYLKEIAQCNVVGIDPDLFDKGVRHLGHGVSKEYIVETELTILESIGSLSDQSIERVFCISVIEHLPRRIIPSVVREMTRILKPGGLLIMTVDVNIHYDTTRPMDLIWESGLVPLGELILRWPPQRFGRADDVRFSADVYGLVLEKPRDLISEHYLDYYGGKIIQTDISTIRRISEKNVLLPTRLRRWVKAEFTGR